MQHLGRLVRPPHVPSRRTLRRWLVGATSAVLASMVGLWLFAELAPLEPLDARAPVGGTVVRAADGTVLWRDEHEGLRIPVSLERVAPIMRRATIAAEDERFERHPGVDPIAMARALLVDRGASGASTITQQLARRLYLDGGSGPLVWRKAHEALIALQLEARTSKDELLEAYLNDVYYGHGAYGVEAAAQTYFGVSAADLDVAQAALMAGLVQRPADLDPFANPEGALSRRDYVLDRLVSAGALTAIEATIASEQPLRLIDLDAPPLAPHFAQYVLSEVASVAPELVRREGLVVVTTLDGALQREAERSVRVRLEALERHEARDAAVVAIEPSTGRITALVGGVDFWNGASGQVNLALSRRQPGSALKPFVYAAALEQGMTAASTILDVPTSFVGDTGTYVPVNYDLRYRGPVTLREALASSLNVPAVRTLDAVGVDGLLEMAARAGIEGMGTTEVYGLALALGGAEVTPLDLTAAYGAIANGGVRVAPYAIERIEDQSGHVLYQHPSAETRRVISAEHAFLLADILSDPVARELGFGRGSVLETPFGAAVKTGTSSYYRDNWTVGFTPEQVVGVWVGNANGQAMRDISGVDGAAPIWRDVLTAAVEARGSSGFKAPASMVRAEVCGTTGLQPGAACPSPRLEWFVAGTEPADTETTFGLDGRGLVATAPPDEAQAWALDAGLRLGGAPAGSGTQTVTIVQPAPGSVLFLAPELEAQELVLRAAVPLGTVRTEFALDGRVIKIVEGLDARAVWRLEAGGHELTVRAVLEDGTSTTATSFYQVEPARASNGGMP
ncbi:MAG: transglycosylase domain-containing protein [Dehalococcoidia bacterium]